MMPDLKTFQLNTASKFTSNISLQFLCCNSLLPIGGHARWCKYILSALQSKDYMGHDKKINTIVVLLATFTSLIRTSGKSVAKQTEDPSHVDMWQRPYQLSRTVTSNCWWQSMFLAASWRWGPYVESFMTSLLPLRLENSVNPTQQCCDGLPSWVALTGRSVLYGHTSFSPSACLSLWGADWMALSLLFLSPPVWLSVYCWLCFSPPVTSAACTGIYRNI